MPKSSLNKTINLLTPIMEPEDIWTKIYNWVTQVGKYLLVFVCAVVLAVFFARFFLDKRNNDLTTEINDKINGMLSIQAKRDEETRYRDYADLVADIATISNAQVLNSTKIAAAIDAIPEEFRLQSISFDGERINMALTATKLDDIGKYSSDLNNNPSYKDVRVSVSKTSGNSSLVDFTISFTLVSQTVQ